MSCEGGGRRERRAEVLLVKMGVQQDGKVKEAEWECKIIESGKKVKVTCEVKEVTEEKGERRSCRGRWRYTVGEGRRSNVKV